MKHLFSKLSLFVLAVPILIGLVHSLIGMTIGWEWLFLGHDNAFYGGVAKLRHPAIGFAWVMCLLLVCCEVGKRLPKIFHSTLAASSVLFLIAFVARFLFVFLFCEGTGLEGGDSEWAWQRATGAPVEDNRHLYFPAWMNFALFLKLIYWISGGGEFILGLIGPLSGGFTAMMIFVIAKDVVSPRNALVGALLYAVSPTSIAYSFQITPEHLAIPCFAVGAMFVLKALARERAFRQGHRLWALAGVAVALGDAVKPFYPVFLAGVLGSVAVICFQMPFCKCRVVRVVTGVLLMTVVRCLLVLSVTDVSERIFGCRLDTADPVPHYLAVGLDRTGEGQIHLGRNARTYLKDRMAGMTRRSAEDALRKRLKEDWNGHLGELPRFFLQKTIWAWGENAYSFHRFLSPPAGPRSWAPYACSVAMVYYFVLLSLVMCSFVRLAMFRGGRRMMVWIFCGMIGLAFFMLMLLSESQGRYKCLIMPYLYVLAAIGLSAGEDSKKERKLTL